MWASDQDIAAARQRVRDQIGRVRAAREDGGDAILAERVLRFLWRSYGVMVMARRIPADIPWRPRHLWPIEPEGWA